MVSLGHLSDLHATPVPAHGVRHLLSKRFLGWLSWRWRRSKVHRPDVLEALIRDLRQADPDQVVVTGDLTNVAREEEFIAARDWLWRIGGPERVFAIPGNHDAYVRIPRAASWDYWSEFMSADEGALSADDPTGSNSDPAAGFPTLRVRGPLALIGVCSARPTAPLRATGRVGAAQLERLERTLNELFESDLCRIVLIHHPPLEGVASRRRALTDASGLRAVLARTGADLVLHGHTHRTSIGEIPGPQRPIPVVGARSSSYVGGKPYKRSQYHLYAIEREGGRAAGARFRVTLRVRGYDPATGGFADEGRWTL